MGTTTRSGGSGSTLAREEAALERARTASDLLDEAVRVPGTNYRVGIDPLLSLVPGVGTVLSIAASLYIVLQAYRLDVPARTLAAMGLFILVDAFGGSIPVLGVVIDAVWKANKWNVGLIERHVESRAGGRRTRPGL